MKKWLIIAAVVAMFAMVFPACGKDEGGITEASDVQMALNDDGDAIVVTWTGDEVGYRYDVVFADVEGVGGGLFADTGPDYYYAPGQNVVIFSLDDDDEIIALGNDTPNQWSAKIAIADIVSAVSAFGTSKKALVGVVALSPGGYSFGSKIKWGETPDGDKFIDWN